MKKKWEVCLIPTDYPEYLSKQLARLFEDGWELVGSIPCLEDIGKGSTATQYTYPHILLKREKVNGRAR
jgi:hypothetical protein